MGASKKLLVGAPAPHSIKRQPLAATAAPSARHIAGAAAPSAAQRRRCPRRCSAQRPAHSPNCSPLLQRQWHCVHHGWVKAAKARRATRRRADAQPYTTTYTILRLAAGRIHPNARPGQSWLSTLCRPGLQRVCSRAPPRARMVPCGP